MSEEINANQNNENEEDDFSWGGCLVTLVVIGAVIWALVHFNPSEEKHREAVREVVEELLMDGQIPSLSASKALANIQYHSIGILSWTSTRYRGRTQLVTAGLLGYVHPFIEF